MMGTGATDATFSHSEHNNGAHNECIIVDGQIHLTPIKKKKLNEIKKNDYETLFKK